MDSSLLRLVVVLISFSATVERRRLENSTPFKVLIVLALPGVLVVNAIT